MIQQQSLKAQIVNALWGFIISNKIKPNEPMRESYLAKMLNVSRTPLREALQQLEWEDIVIFEPRKGYRLAKLSENDVLEIYPLRAKLESFALELSGIPSDQMLDSLMAINARILKAKSSKKIVELDEQWHSLLVSNCPNKRVLKLIKSLHKQSKRYEYAYMAMNHMAEKSVKQHEDIVTFLRNHQLQKAVDLFAQNNLVGMDTLISWLKTINNEE